MLPYQSYDTPVFTCFSYYYSLIFHFLNDAICLKVFKDMIRVKNSTKQCANFFFIKLHSHEARFLRYFPQMLIIFLRHFFHFTRSQWTSDDVHIILIVQYSSLIYLRLLSIINVTTFQICPSPRMFLLDQQ